MPFCDETISRRAFPLNKKEVFPQKENLAEGSRPIVSK
jgi:hypothetical protein